MIPAEAEAVVDLTNDRLRLGDGLTLGGLHLPNYKDIQGQKFSYWADTGAVNALVITPSPALVGGYGAGTSFEVRVANTNNGAATINVNGVGAVNIYKDTGTGIAALTGGELVAGNIIRLTHNGSQFQIMNSAAPVSSAGLVLLGTASFAAGAISITSLITSTYDEYLIKFRDILADASGSLLLQMSTNNGSSYISTGYANQAADGLSVGGLTSGIYLGGISTSSYSSGDVSLFNVNNTSGATANDKVTHYRGTGAGGGFGASRISYGQPSFSNAIVNAVRISGTGGTPTSGTATIYGYSK